MPEQIIIEFLSDASQLQPTIDLLASMGQIDKEAAATFKQSNAEIAKKIAATKQLSAENSKAAKTFQDIEKGMAAAADMRYKAALQALEKQVEELKATVDDYSKKLDEAGKSTQDTGNQAQSARARLRAMREELVLLASQGKQNTARFRELQAEAGELADTTADVQSTIAATGSDTKNLSGLIGIAQGVAGGFAVAQGATALFGGASEQLNEVLQKTQGIMAIIQGLQELQNILQKESTANIFLTTVARRADVVATEAETVAQEGLNTAMKLNPAGLVIGAILALITAYEAFSHTTKESSENLELFNEVMADAGRAASKQITDLEILYSTATNVNNSMKDRVAAVKALQAEFPDYFKNISQETILNGGAKKQYDDLAQSILATAKATAAKTKLDELASKQLDIAFRKEKINNAIGAENERARARNRIDPNARYAGTLTNDQYSFKEFMAAQEERRRAVLAQQDEQSETLQKQADFLVKFAGGEKQVAKVIEEGSAGAVKAEEDKAQKLAEARAKAAEEARKKQLEIENTANAELKKIQDENYLASFESDVQRAKEKAVLEYKNERDRINALQISEKTRSALLQELRQKEYNELAAIDRKAADERAKYEQEIAAGRAAALQAAEKGALAGIERINANELARLNDLHSKKLISEKEYLLAVAKLTGDYSKYNEFLSDEKVKKQKEQAEALKGIFTDLGSSFRDIYGTDASSVALQNLDNLGAKAIDVFQKIKEGAISTGEGIKLLAQDFLTAITAVGTQVFADQRQQRQADLREQLDAIAAARDQELSNANLTAQQKADIKTRYDAKEKAAKLKAFEADKQAARVQAEIQGAVAVIKSLAVYGYTPAGLIAAAAATAQTLIEVALINRKQPPRYKLGKKRGQAVPDSGWAYVDDGGRREPILRQDGSVEWASGPAKERLTLLHRNDEVFPSIDHFLDRFQLPSVPAEILAVPGGGSHSGSVPIDYDKLADAIAKKIPEPVVNSIVMDEAGFTKHIIKKGIRQQILNNYHKFSK